MGKVLGIIAEYNPFHNGHLYHLLQSKKDTGATYTVAIMSGNFTQRGNTALLDKWSRAEAAIKSGVDLVIELPLLYSISSAENFADGAIKILESLKVVDYISFGAETNDLQTLNKYSEILSKEPKKYKTILTSELDKGLSFPKARENALSTYLNIPNNTENILSSPNNILGIEYLKALKKHKSNIQPNIIKRYNVGYHDLDPTENIASATAIRNIIKNNGFDILRNLLPEPTYSSIITNMRNGHIIPDISVFDKQIIYLLRKMSVEEIADLPDVSEGLEYAIKNTANSCNSLVEFLNIIKSKRYTNTRIQRIMVYALLGITKKDIELSKKITQPYVRVLGFNNRGKFLISEAVKANPKLEIITSVKKFMDSTQNKSLKTMFEKDIFATNVYTIGYQYDSWNNLDYTKKMVIL